jgi:hypothetical protein
LSRHHRRRLLRFIAHPYRKTVNNALDVKGVAQFADPPGPSLGEKLERLAVVRPSAVDIVDRFVDDMLKRFGR